MATLRRIPKLILLVALGGICQSACTQSSFDSDGVRISFKDQGNGEPIVFLHGFSQTMDMWSGTGILEDLAQDYRVIVMDLRGHGASGKPHLPQAYGANMGRDVIRLLDHLEIQKAHLIGFSMGASIAGGLLISHPNRVQTATLGSGFFPSWDEAEEEFADFTVERGRSGERYPWEPSNQDFQALAAAIRGARHSVVTSSEISEIETPTLVVFGSLELDETHGALERSLENLPSDVGVLIIDGADHDSDRAAILQPQFKRAVRRFIEANPFDDS